jgi:endonuclease/exonuclease/phosphatase family metal-dependent hydrolase
MRTTSRLLAAMAILAMACTGESSSYPEGVLGPGTEPTAETRASSGVTVLTRNLYVGTDVDAVIGALQTPDPADDLPTLIAAIETLRRTDFPSRARAFADEVARARPHVVGLQEVSQVDLVLPPLGVDVHLDFLPALLAELSARGLHYVVAAKIRNIDAQPIPGVRLVDYDAMLVDRRRVELLETNAASFAANLGEVAPGVVLRRGWVTAKGVVRGVTYTFASTHLESGQLPGLDQLRAAQAGELVQVLAGARSVVLMGDLNDIPGSPMHQVLVGAGYQDFWAAFRPGESGFTCCHAPDLSNPVQHFDERIDYLLVRHAPHPGPDFSGWINLVGDDPADRIAGPEGLIWPSDHAGLLARLRAPAGEGRGPE